MTVSASGTAGAGEEYGRQRDWIGPTLERVAKAFAVTAPQDGGRSRSATAFKIEWPPDVIWREQLIEREDHDAAVRFLRDYTVGYGSQGVVPPYGEQASSPSAGLIYDKRLQAVTHRKGTDLGNRARRRQHFELACAALRHANRQQALVVAGLTAIAGLSPLDGSPYMNFTRLGEWWMPPVSNPKQRAMAGKTLLKMTCEALRRHYETLADEQR